MNSHHYMARDGAVLITAFLGAKEVWDAGVKATAKK